MPRDFPFNFIGLIHRQLGGGGAGGFASNFPAGPVGTAGTYNFVPVSSGFYLFVAWGPGGLAPALASPGAGSGAYLEVTRFLAAGSITVVRPGRVVTVEASTITFPDTSVASAGAGAAAGAGGIAAGGDFMLNGSVGQPNGAAGLPGAGTGGGTGSAALGGAAPKNGAPGRLPFRGGSGNSNNGEGQSTPGAAGVFPNPGGDGMILVVKVS